MDFSILCAHADSQISKFRRRHQYGPYPDSKEQIFEIPLRGGGGLIPFQSRSLNNDLCYTFYPQLGYIENQIVSCYIPPIGPKQRHESPSTGLIYLIDVAPCLHLVKPALQLNVFIRKSKGAVSIIFSTWPIPRKSSWPMC